MKEYVCTICGRRQMDESEACPHCGGAWKEFRKKSVGSLVMGILSFVLSIVGFLIIIVFIPVLWFVLFIFTFGQYSDISGIQSVGYVGVAVLAVFAAGSLALCIVQTARRRKLAIAGLVLTVLSIGMNIITFVMLNGIQAG